MIGFQSRPTLTLPECMCHFLHVWHRTVVSSDNKTEHLIACMCCVVDVRLHELCCLTRFRYELSGKRNSVECTRVQRATASVVVHKSINLPFEMQILLWLYGRLAIWSDAAVSRITQDNSQNWITACPVPVRVPRTAGASHDRFP